MNKSSEYGELLKHQSSMRKSSPEANAQSFSPNRLN